MDRHDLHVLEQKVLAELVDRHDNLAMMDAADLRQAIAASGARHIFNASWTLSERHALIERIFNRVRGLDVIQPLLDDPTISEIMINRADTIYIERNGRIERTTQQFTDERHLMQVMGHAYAQKNRALSMSRPANDLLLDDGSRVHGITWPLSPDGPTFTIRKFTSVRPDAKTLIANGFIPPEMYQVLEAAVHERRSVFICGGTGSGKTTLLNILSAAISPYERVVTIEDSCELQLQGLPNLIRLEAQAHSTQWDREQTYDIGALIRESLRMRPDRIIVGEVRGHEAADMLEAMNTGHSGTLSTGHGNSCADMARRIAHLVLAATRLPYTVILADIAAAFDLFVHVERDLQGHRHVTEIAQTRGVANESVRFETLYTRIPKEAMEGRT